MVNSNKLPFGIALIIVIVVAGYFIFNQGSTESAPVEEPWEEGHYLQTSLCGITIVEFREVSQLADSGMVVGEKILSINDILINITAANEEQDVRKALYINWLVQQAEPDEMVKFVTDRAEYLLDINQDKFLGIMVTDIKCSSK